MRSRDIPDSAITASSIYDEYHQAYHGRLDNRAKTEDFGRWSSKKVSFVIENKTINKLYMNVINHIHF